MNRAYIVYISSVLIAFACSPVNNVSTLQQQTMQRQGPNQELAPSFYLEYSFSEMLPNPASDGKRKRRFIEVRFDGSYQLKQEVVLANNDVGYSNTMNGVLLVGQLQRLNQVVKKLDMGTIPSSNVSLASGAGIESAWNGYVKYTENGSSHDIKFTSQSLQGQSASADTRARFLRFLREMDDFFLAEFKL